MNLGNKKDNYIFNAYDIDYGSSRHIDGISVLKIDSSYQFRSILHRHLFYELIVVIEGTGRHEADFESYDVHPMSIHCIRPGELHRMTLSPPYSGYFIMFNLDFLATYSPHCRPDQMDCFHGETSIRWIPLTSTILDSMTQLYESHKSSHDLREVHSAALLTTILININNQIEKNALKRTQYSTISRQFLKLLSVTLPPKKTVQDYSDILHINANYLNNIVKKDTGKTAGTWIHEQRILEAKRLLVKKDISINTIAYTLNFSDSSAFCRFFKQATDMTPKQFRALK